MSYQLPANAAENERTVEQGFWKKLLGLAGKLPFAEELAAAYYCAFDRNTPGKVEQGFWKKLLGLAGKLPFAEELAAAYYCAFDRNTPGKVRAMLMAALAYFVLPFDVIPDFLAGIGYTDDAAVIAGTIALVARHITPEHYAKARAALGIKPKEP